MMVANVKSVSALWMPGAAPTSGIPFAWENALRNVGLASWPRSAAMACASRGKIAVLARGIVPASRVTGAIKMFAKRGNVRPSVMVWSAGRTAVVVSVACARMRCPIATMAFALLIASLCARARPAGMMLAAASVASAARGMSAWRTTAARRGVAARIADLTVVVACAVSVARAKPAPTVFALLPSPILDALPRPTSLPAPVALARNVSALATPIVAIPNGIQPVLTSVRHVACAQWSMSAGTSCANLGKAVESAPATARVCRGLCAPMICVSSVCQTATRRSAVRMAVVAVAEPAKRISNALSSSASR